MPSLLKHLFPKQKGQKGSYKTESDFRVRPSSLPPGHIMVHVVEAGGEHQLPVTDSSDSVHAHLLLLLLLLHHHVQLFSHANPLLLLLLLPFMTIAQTLDTNSNNPLLNASALQSLPLTIVPPPFQHPSFCQQYQFSQNASFSTFSG